MGIICGYCDPENILKKQDINLGKVQMSLSTFRISLKHASHGRIYAIRLNKKARLLLTFMGLMQAVYDRKVPIKHLEIDYDRYIPASVMQLISSNLHSLDSLCFRDSFFEVE